MAVLLASVFLFSGGLLAGKNKVLSLFLEHKCETETRLSK